MLDGLVVKVVIPALNEAQSIGRVLADVPRWADEVLVVDNASTDQTAAIAAGAGVVAEPRRGCGQACSSRLGAVDWCDTVVFLDGDHSGFPAQMQRLVEPIAAGRADMVLGRRIAIHGDARALTIPQRVGTALAGGLVRLCWQAAYRDSGPFRASRRTGLRALDMRDTTWGWTAVIADQGASGRAARARDAGRLERRIVLGPQAGMPRAALSRWH